MDQIYAGHGIEFKYPGEWQLNVDEQLDEVSITVSSAQTSFWSLSLFLDRPAPEEIMEAVLDAFREEYDELDFYPAKARLCRRPTLARDIEFVCLELLNSAWARVFRGPRATVLVLYQANDREIEENGSVLEAMTRSLRLQHDEA